MMRERRYRGGFRARSPPLPPLPPPPSRSKTRSREYSPPPREIGDRRRTSQFAPSLDTIPSDSERSRRIERRSGSAKRRDYDRRFDDGDRDAQSRRQSQFNRSLSRGDSTSMKLYPKQILAEPKKCSRDEDYDHHFYRSIDSYGATKFSTESNYQDKRYTGMLIEKPISIETNRERSYSFYPPDVGVSESSGHLDSGFTYPSLNLNMGLLKEEGFESRHQSHLDKLLIDKPPGRELYMEEGNSMVYSKDASDYRTSFSVSDAISRESLGISNEEFHVSLKKDFRAPLEGYRLSTEMITRPVGHDGYGRESHAKSPVDGRDYPNTFLSPTEGKHGDYKNLEGQRGVRGHIGRISEEFYGKMVTSEEKYGHGDFLRTSLVDPIVDRINECTRREHLGLGESRLWDHVASSQGQPMPNHLDASRLLHLRKQDGEVLGYRKTHLKYEREVFQDHGSLLSGEGRGYERGGAPWSHEESSEMLPMTETRTLFKRKRGMDKKSSRHIFGSKISSNGKSIGKTHGPGFVDERRTSEDGDPLFWSKKSRFSHSQYGKTGRVSNETGSLSKPQNSNGRDIKKRLGPGPQSIHVSHPSVKNEKALLKNRLGPGPQNIHSSNPSVKSGKALVKKRLGPGPKKNHVTLPWLNNYKPWKFSKRIQDGSDGGLCVQEGDPFQGNVTTAKAEPPENSEDFKKLMHSAFFRFVKQLSGDSAQKRRFMEQGKSGSLKCSICGSNSEEFVDTESLAMHAFASPMVGFRSQHLGFHKALCVLMGWKSAMAPNIPWVPETLSDAETFALKEDLIIWPPVVIIHNSSIRNKNPDELVIVSNEVLEIMLKDMGFGEKTKVCHGKPLNQSLMVVRFNGTFSGLQEAERLHKFYVETKKGRAEFDCINTGDSSSIAGETRKASADKVKHVLYGHLGLAEDLDKLDFETKKRCLVKSKREIQNIADAPLNTE